MCAGTIAPSARAGPGLASTACGQCNLGELVLMRIADDAGYAGKVRNLLGSALCVTSGDNDSCFWILPPHAADGCTRILIGGRGDGAGIQHYKLGLPRSRGTVQ